MIRRWALSSILISPTIPLLYDVMQDSPDDEFQDAQPRQTTELNETNVHVKYCYCYKQVTVLHDLLLLHFTYETITHLSIKHPQLTVNR